MSPISFNTHPKSFKYRGIQLSKNACLFRVYRILYSTTQFCGDYFINHDIRIPSLNNQDSMESKAGFQFLTQLFVVCCCPPRGPSSVRTFGRSPAAIMRTGCQWRGWKCDRKKHVGSFVGLVLVMFCHNLFELMYILFGYVCICLCVCNIFYDMLSCSYLKCVISLGWILPSKHVDKLVIQGWKTMVLKKQLGWVWNGLKILKMAQTGCFQN